MASIDYGTILVKNGTLIDTTRSMKSTDLGVSFDEIMRNIDYNGHTGVDAGGSVIVGDDEFCITFWKTHATIIMNHKVCGQIWFGRCGCFGFTQDEFHITTKAPWEKILNIFNSGTDIIIECIDHNIRQDKYGIKYYSDRYHVQFEYKGNTYDIYTGYGIDSRIEVYNRIKFSAYGYTEKEREVLDNVFGIF